MEKVSWTDRVRNEEVAITLSQGKQSRYRPEQTQRVGRGIALLFRDLGARRGWVVSLISRPIYPRERPATHCT
jgi:hypothetical protein